jgi:hypothetical protein
MLPHARRLLQRRARGDEPWLVVVSCGGGGVCSLTRRAYFKDGRTAWLRVPDELRLDEADWSVAVALDVLLVPEGGLDYGRFQAICGAFWRARVATLWCVRSEDVNLAGRLCPIESSRYGLEFLLGSPHEVALDNRFSQRLDLERRAALLGGDAPLFDDPIFAAARLTLFRQCVPDFKPECAA